MTDSQLVSRRIALIRRELCHDSNTEFARLLNKSRQHVSALCSGRSKAGKQTLDIILATFPAINRDWLYFGNGQMLNDAPDTQPSACHIYADIADTFAHLSQLYNQLSLCVKQ